MNKLDSYLEQARLTNAAFATRVGVSEATISRLRNGKQTASHELIRRIVSETGGQIEPNDFFNDAEAAE